MDYTNSMQKGAYFFLLVFLFVFQTSNSNLISDPSFTQQQSSLTQTDSSGLQTYTYTTLSSSETNWYSLYSGTVKIRSSSLNLTVMDTLNNNSYQKTCQNFAFQSLQIPYQFSYSYFIDKNINHASLTVTFNGQTITQGEQTKKYLRERSLKVYLNQSSNILCFIGSTYESSYIGVLVTELMLQPYLYVDVIFKSFYFQEEINYIYILSDLAVNQTEFQIFQQDYTFSIENLYYRLQGIMIYNGYLAFKIQIYEQYTPSETYPKITLPTIRGRTSQMTAFNIQQQSLCRYIYSSTSDQKIVQNSQNVLVALTKSYNIIYRIIKIVSINYLGLRFMNFYSLLTLLSFLQIQLLLPIARQVIQVMGKWTIDGTTFNYFRKLSDEDVFTYGNVPILQQFQENKLYGMNYSEASITPNFYPLFIDNFIIVVFNFLKGFLIYYLIAPKYKFKNELKQIRSYKILLQLINVLSLIVLISFVTTVQSLGIFNIYGKINKYFVYLLPILIPLLSIFIFTLQYNRLKLQLSKFLLKVRNQLKTKTKDKIQFYHHQLYLQLLENMMFFVVPALVGLGHVYSCLIIFLFFSIVKIFFTISCFVKKPEISTICWSLTSFLQMCIILTYFTAHLVQSFQNLESISQYDWLLYLKPNTYVIMYMLAIGGFIQISCCLFYFVRGIIKFRHIFVKIFGICYRNQIANSNQNLQVGEQPKLIQVRLSNQINNFEFIDNLKNLHEIKNNSQAQSPNTNGEQDQIDNPFQDRKKVAFTTRKYTQQDEDDHLGICSDMRKKQKFEKKGQFDKPMSKTIKRIQKMQVEKPEVKQQDSSNKKKVKKIVSLSRFLSLDIEQQAGKTEDIIQQNQKQYQRQRQRPKTEHKVHQEQQDEDLVIIKKRSVTKPKTKKVDEKKLNTSLKQITEQSQGPNTYDNIPAEEDDENKNNDEHENFS